MAKKLEKVVEEVKAFEVELVAKVKSAFHTVCTKFGNVEFVEGKVTVSSDNKELINELENLNVIHPVENPPEQIQSETKTSSETPNETPNEVPNETPSEK